MPEKCIKDYVAAAKASVAHQPPNQINLIKMKSMILVALALVAVAVAVPVDVAPVEILRSSFDQQPDGAYEFGFQTSDGTGRQETGELKEALDEDNKPHTVVVVRGSYTFVNPDGVEETINYTADESGYHAEGPSIPKAARR